MCHLKDALHHGAERVYHTALFPNHCSGHATLTLRDAFKKKGAWNGVLGGVGRRLSGLAKRLITNTVGGRQSMRLP